MPLGRVALAALALLVVAVAKEHDYYKLLKVKKGCSDKELKKAYREAAKKYHPDKNVGDEQAAKKFALVAKAYEVLSDPEQKRIYDLGGEEALKRGGGNGGGGGGGFQQQSGGSPFGGGFGGGGGSPFGGGGNPSLGRGRGEAEEQRLEQKRQADARARKQEEADARFAKRQAEKAAAEL
ncbi:hypothetical protein JL722_11443 [Aureococcus anophagefferens]|nr:hypothetical protein JL722_11443 [Aureococcus anophagefferens]